jgi:hypothetical protein
MIFRSIAALLAAGVFVFAVGCGSPPAQSKTLPLPKAMVATGDLTGSWACTKGDGVIIFAANGKFQAKWPAKNHTESGAWVAEGNQLTLTSDTGGEWCTDGKGVYVFQVRGDQVIFSVLADECERRHEQLQLPWARLPDK